MKRDIKKPTTNENCSIRAVFRGKSRHCLGVAATMACHLGGKMLLYFAPEWLGMYLASNDRSALFRCHVPATAFKDYVASDTMALHITARSLQDMLDELGGTDDEIIMTAGADSISAKACHRGAREVKIPMLRKPESMTKRMLGLGQVLVNAMNNTLSEDAWHFSIDQTVFKEILDQIKETGIFGEFFKAKMVEKESLPGAMLQDDAWSAIDRGGDKVRPCLAITSTADDHAIRFFANTRDAGSQVSETILKTLKFDDPGYLSWWNDSDQFMEVELRRVHFLGCFLPPDHEDTSRDRYSRITFMARDKKIAGIEMMLDESCTMMYIIPQANKRSLGIQRIEKKGPGNEDFTLTARHHAPDGNFFTDDAHYDADYPEFIEHVDKYIDMAEWTLTKVNKHSFDPSFHYYLVSRQPAVTRFPNIHACISLDDGSFSLYDMNTRDRFKIVHCRHLVLDGERTLSFHQLPLLQSIIATANTWSLGNYETFSPRIMIDSIPVQPSSAGLLKELLQELMLHVRDSCDVYKQVYYFGYVIHAFAKINLVDRASREVKGKCTRYRDSRGYEFVSWDDNGLNEVSERLRITRTHGAPDDPDGISGGIMVDDHTRKDTWYDSFPNYFYEERKAMGTFARDCCAVMNALIIRDPDLFIEAYARFLALKNDMEDISDFGMDWVALDAVFERPLVDSILVDAELASCFYESTTIDADRACSEIARGALSMELPFLLCVYHEIDHALSCVLRFMARYNRKRIQNIHNELVVMRGSAIRWETIRGQMQDRACKIIRDRIATLGNYLDVVEVAMRHCMMDEIKESWPILYLPFISLSHDIIRLHKDKMAIQETRTLEAMKTTCTRILGDRIIRILEDTRLDASS